MRDWGWTVSQLVAYPHGSHALFRWLCPPPTLGSTLSVRCCALELPVSTSVPRPAEPLIAASGHPPCLSCLPASRAGAGHAEHTPTICRRWSRSQRMGESRDRPPERTCLMGVAAGACGRGRASAAGGGPCHEPGRGRAGAPTGSENFFLHEVDRPSLSGSPGRNLTASLAFSTLASVRATSCAGPRVHCPFLLTCRCARVHVPPDLAGRAPHSLGTLPPTIPAGACALTPVPAPVQFFSEATGTAVICLVLYA